MGDVPINPTGFAHGFRPLEGDHPPPTPTQRDMILRSNSNGDHNQFSADCFGLSFLSASSQAPAQDSVRSGGVGPSRKRRRFPGPLAFLQHEGLSNRSSLGDNGRRLDGAGDPDTGGGNGEKGEVGGGHFEKGPWLSVCSAVDAPIPEEGASDADAVDVFLSGALSPMSEVLAGEFDLRVPAVMAVIDVYTRQSQSDTAVELVDPSGRMKGYLHPMCVEEYGPELGPGAALLLKEVSIFISGPGTTRLLNIHPDCILAVFPPDTPPPPPVRLDWLRNCDPPFTPRLVDVSGDNAPPNPDQRLSPPFTFGSTAPRPRSPCRRRLRTPVGGNIERPSPPPPPSHRQIYKKNELPTARSELDVSTCNASVAGTRRLCAPGRDVTVSSPPMVGQGSSGPPPPAPQGPSSHLSKTPIPPATSQLPATPAQKCTHKPSTTDGVERASRRGIAGAAGLGDKCASMPRGRLGINTSRFPSDVDKEGAGAPEERNVHGGKAKTLVTHVDRSTSREVSRPKGDPERRGAQGPQDHLGSAPDGDKGGDTRPDASLPSSIWTNLGGVDSDDSEGDCNSSHGDAVTTGEFKEVITRGLNIGKTSSIGGDDLAQRKSLVPMDPSYSASNSEDVVAHPRRGNDNADASQGKGSTDPDSEKNQSRASEENQANSGAGWTFSLLREGGESDAFLDAALEDDCDLY